MFVDDEVEFSFQGKLELAEKMTQPLFFPADDVWHPLVEVFDEKGVLLMLSDNFFVDLSYLFLLLEDQMRQLFTLLIFGDLCL